MAIRFLLVSLVAGLGLEAPSAQDVATWTRSGRDWVQARVDDFSNRRVIAESEQANVAFDGVVARMADDFTADLASIDQPKPIAILSFEPITVPEELDSGMGYAMNRQAQGEGRQIEIAVPDELELGIAFELNRDSQGQGQVVTISGPPAEPDSSTSPEPIRASRLASAVRLTGQAAQAWMTLLRESDRTAIRY